MSDEIDALRAELREFVDREIAHLWKLHSTERTMLQESVREWHAQMDQRLGALNDLRQEVLTDRGQFVTRIAFEGLTARVEKTVEREYYDQRHSLLRDRIDANATALSEVAKDASNIRSRSSAYAAALGAAISVLTIVMLIVQFLHTK